MRAVNLIPAEEREGAGMGAGRSQGVAYAILVLLGGIALLAFLYGQANHQISSRRTQAASLREQAQHAQAQASQLAPYTTFVSLREQREHAVATLVDSRFDWAHVMHEFGRVLPAGVSLSTLSGTVGTTTGGTSAASSQAPPRARPRPPPRLPAACLNSRSAAAQSVSRWSLRCSSDCVSSTA